MQEIFFVEQKIENDFISTLWLKGLTFFDSFSSRLLSWSTIEMFSNWRQCRYFAWVFASSNENNHTSLSTHYYLLSMCIFLSNVTWNKYCFFDSLFLKQNNKKKNRKISPSSPSFFPFSFNHFEFNWKTSDRISNNKREISYLMLVNRYFIVVSNENERWRFFVFTFQLDCRRSRKAKEMKISIFIRSICFFSVQSSAVVRLRFLDSLYSKEKRTLRFSSLFFDLISVLKQILFVQSIVHSKPDARTHWKTNVFFSILVFKRKKNRSLKNDYHQVWTLKRSKFQLIASIIFIQLL